jgi:hypothetical protein
LKVGCSASKGTTRFQPHAAPALPCLHVNRAPPPLYKMIPRQTAQPPPSCPTSSSCPTYLRALCFCSCSLQDFLLPSKADRSWKRPHCWQKRCRRPSFITWGGGGGVKELVSMHAEGRVGAQCSPVQVSTASCLHTRPPRNANKQVSGHHPQPHMPSKADRSWKQPHRWQKCCRRPSFISCGSRRPGTWHVQDQEISSFVRLTMESASVQASFSCGVTSILLTKLTPTHEHTCVQATPPAYLPPLMIFYIIFYRILYSCY